MYKLTLTYDERRAIEFIGDRYSCGNDLYDLLIDCTEIDFDSDQDIEFDIPENLAWTLQDFVNDDTEGETSHPLLCDETYSKLRQFCDNII